VCITTSSQLFRNFVATIKKRADCSAPKEEKITSLYIAYDLFTKIKGRFLCQFRMTGAMLIAP
jgi:hypothetical protein